MAGIWLWFSSVAVSLWDALGCISQRCPGCQAGGHRGDHSNLAVSTTVQSCAPVFVGDLSVCVGGGCYAVEEGEISDNE